MPQRPNVPTSDACPFCSVTMSLATPPNGGPAIVIKGSIELKSARFQVQAAHFRQVGIEPTKENPGYIAQGKVAECYQQRRWHSPENEQPSNVAGFSSLRSTAVLS